MTRKANRGFLALGAASAVLALAAGQWREAVGHPAADFLVPALMLAAFFLLLILGILPWAGSLVMRYPLHNTLGYRPDLSPEPETEAGAYPSQGWRRRNERAGLLFLKSTGLFIEAARKG